MAFTKGTAKLTNASSVATEVALTSGQLAYFSSGTAVFVQSQGQLIEAVGLPKDGSGNVIPNQFLLREPWDGATGTYEFVAFDTIEGLRDAVQSARGFSEQLQAALSSFSVAPQGGSNVKRTNDGRVKAENATESDDAVPLGQLPSDIADLYAKSSILGPVSESNGAPTGAIIERGGNANGEYVKYADGTAICWVSKNLENSFSTMAFGSLFRSGTNVLNLPIAFVDTNYSASIRWGLTQEVIDTVENVGVRTTSSIGLNFILNSNRATPYTVPISLVIIGRWYQL